MLIQRRTKFGKRDSYSLSIVVGCKGRLGHLQESIGHMIRESDEVIVVDYDCPDNTIYELRNTNVKCIKVHDKPFYNRSHAKNIGGRAARGSMLAFIDADAIIHSGFKSFVLNEISKGVIGFTFQNHQGQIIITKTAFNRIKGFNESVEDWGWEDHDFAARAGLIGEFPHVKSNIVHLLPHSDEMRTIYHKEQNIMVSNEKNAERFREFRNKHKHLGNVGAWGQI